MRKVDEIYNDFWGEDFEGYHSPDDVKCLIAKLQKEFWNEAIEAAAENALIGVKEYGEGEPIIIGREVQVNDYGDTYCVLPMSILKLKK